VRVYQNNRNTEQRGAILPVDTGATNSGLTDMLADTTRQRLYIANPGLNRVEVFDMQRKQFLAPITVGQLPRSLAFGQDNNTLYVANSGGEKHQHRGPGAGHCERARPLPSDSVQREFRADYAYPHRLQPARPAGADVG